MDEKRNGRFRKKRSNFSMVSNEIIRDSSISLKAKGLYALIQSYITIEGFTLYKWFLQSRCSEGKKAFNSAWNELKESGYLLQYRMQDHETKHFYWEYELLDQKEEKAISPKREHGSEKSYTPKRYYGLGNTRQRDNMEKGDDINNTQTNNYIENNIYLISVNDVNEQIDLSEFNFFDHEQAQEIALLITDVFNMPDDSMIRVSGIERTAKEVKERFKLVDHYHIQYVIDAIKETTTTIKNKRNYLITAIYNAPTTLETHYQSLVNSGL